MSEITPFVFKNSPHLVALDDTFKEAFKNAKATNALVYNFDTVPAAALPYLAKQFNVEGNKGYSLTNTEQEKRELLKKALKTAKYKGTPQSIIDIIKAVGYSNCTINENTDGVFTFRVSIDLGNDKGLSVVINNLLIECINYYKRAVCHLMGIEFTVSMVTTGFIGDNAYFMSLPETLYDDTHYYDISENLFYSTQIDFIEKIQFGTSNAETATEITDPFTKDLEVSRSQIEGVSYTFNWLLETGECNGKIIYEIGLLDATGTLIARYVRANPISKTSDSTIIGTWTINL